MSDKIGTNFHVHKSHVEGCALSLMLWPYGHTSGVHATALMTEAQARDLIAELEKALAKLPRVGTPADLGCEVL